MEDTWLNRTRLRGIDLSASAPRLTGCVVQLPLCSYRLHHQAIRSSNARRISAGPGHCHRQQRLGSRFGFAAQGSVVVPFPIPKTIILQLAPRWRTGRPHRHRSMLAHQPLETSGVYLP